MKKIGAPLIFSFVFVLFVTFQGFSQDVVASINPGQNIPIVASGEAKAVIVIANNANLRIRQGANNLAQYVKQSTGAELQVITESALDRSSLDYAGLTRIYIGNELISRSDEQILQQSLKDLDPQGFVIHAKDDAVTIAGPTLWGTLNGIHDFLERFIGVRWFMIGPSGEHIPELTDVKIPAKTLRQQPAFAVRILRSPFIGDDPYIPLIRDREEMMWAHRNKLQGNYNIPIAFGHNLHTVFPPEKFGATNPEFYPRGRVPQSGSSSGWQPCFSVPETIDVAVEHILDYFKKNPDETTFVLDVNDLGGFCEQNPSHPAYPGRINSAGYVDMSEIYYTWVNAVVEQVSREYPDKWFPVLAYREVVDPPEFSLHPRIIPRITKDRMTWADEEIRSSGHEQMKAWNEVARQVLWSDYMYGFVFHVPRPFPRLMAETIRYAKEHDVIGLHIENHYHAGEGPKAWLLAKLLWDPDQDIEMLLAEWYEGVVGPQAAADLAAFYDHWERFWTERIPQTPWFQQGKITTYLPFSDPSYLAYVTEEDIEISKKLLDSVVMKAQTDAQKRRAQLIRESLDFYEAAALSYPQNIEILSDPKQAADTIETFARIVQRRIEFAERRYVLHDEFRRHADRNMRIRPVVGGAFFQYWWTDWTGWDSFDLTIINNHMRIYEPEGGPMTDRLAELSRSDDDFLRTLAYAIQMSQGGFVEAPSLTVNSSFEKGDSDATSWTFHTEKSGTFRRVEDNSHMGNAALRADGVRSGRVSQLLDISWGFTAAQIRYYTPEGTRSGTIQLEIHGRNSRGATVTTVATSARALAPTAGTWSSLELIDVLSSGLDRTEITHAEIVIHVRDAQHTQVYIDDVVVFQNVPLGATISFAAADGPDRRPNIALGKPTRASSYGSRLSTPDQAVDGDLSSRWFTQTGASPPHWLEIDLLGTFQVESAEVWSGVVGQTGAYSIGHMQLQYWTEEGWKDIPGASIRNNREELVTFTFAQPVVTNRIRFVSETKESPDGLGLRFREILLYGTPTHRNTLR